MLATPPMSSTNAGWLTGCRPPRMTLPGMIKQTYPAWRSTEKKLYLKASWATVSTNHEVLWDCCWFMKEVEGYNPPTQSTLPVSFYLVQLWSWVTGPLCDASDPKPIYCLKSLPLSTAPSSTSSLPQHYPPACLFQRMTNHLQDHKWDWDPCMALPCPPYSLPRLLREGIPHPAMK